MALLIITALISCHSSNPFIHVIHIQQMSMSSMHSMDQMCKSYCIDLVPMLVLTTSTQTNNVTIDLLKNFSHKMLCLSFQYELVHFENSIHRDRHNGVDSSAESSLDDDLHKLCQTRAIACCEKVLLLIQQAGFTSIHLCSNPWTKKTASPYSIAVKLGLSVIQHESIDDLIPPSLFMKPMFIGMGTYLNELIRIALKNKQKNVSMSVFPAFSAIDCLYPSVLTKYMCFLFAGLAWNYESVIDMLRVGTKTALWEASKEDEQSEAELLDTHHLHNHTNRTNQPNTRNSKHHFDQLGVSTVYCGSIFREVISLLLFNRRVIWHPSSTAESHSHSGSSSVFAAYDSATAKTDSCYASFLSALTSEWFFSSHNMLPTATGSGAVVDSNSSSSNSNQSAVKPSQVGDKNHSVTSTTTAALTKSPISIQNLSKTEQALWSIFTCPNELFMTSMAPSKVLIAECLRYYRRLLTQANWKQKTSATKRGFLENFTGFYDSSNVSRSNGVHSGNSLDYDSMSEVELDEYFSMLHMVSIICRAAILSYIAYEKKMGGMSPRNGSTDSLSASVFSAAAAVSSNGVTATASTVHTTDISSIKWGELLVHLPPGSKSDIANQLLEAMAYTVHEAKSNRFDKLFFQHDLATATTTLNGSVAVASATTMTRFFQQQYLINNTPIVPILALFGIVSQSLSMPQSPEVTLKNIFPKAKADMSSLH